MRLTAEIRWFWPDRPPREFQDWFVGAGAACAEAGERRTRVDEYLRDLSHDSLGIKRRGGREVEIKGLIARRDRHLEFAGCRSPIELWAKWSSPALDLDGLPLLRVQKQRWMRSFVVHAGAVSELATSSEPAPRHLGCDAELTLLKGPDTTHWWTFGLEAHGELDEVERALSLTVALMTRRSPPPLPPGEAVGYPCWLASKGW